MKVFLDVLLNNFLISFSIILCVSSIVLIILDYIFNSKESSNRNSNEINISEDKSDSDLISEIYDKNLIPFDRTIKSDDNINNMF